MAEQSRWWDKYYVRYFVGTVYGVPLLLALAKESPAKSILSNLPESKWSDAAIVAAAGLAFCYLASAPILLLHALRVRIGRTASGYRSLALAFAAITLLAAVVVAAKFVYGVDASYSPRLSILPYLLVLTAEVVGLALTSGSVLRDFYVQLAKERKAEPAAVREDYVESYRHLREHGNALLIILMENALALALWGAADLTSMIALSAIWVLPGAFAWFIGTWLERGLAESELRW